MFVCEFLTYLMVQSESQCLSSGVLNIFIDSVSSPRCSRWIPKGTRNANPFNFLIREIATNDSPDEKSFGPRSITAFSSVRPWLLCMVIAQAKVNGSCSRESWFPDLSSHRATTGEIGIHDELTPCQPGV